ncbi:MAG: serine/threonine protein kinase [Actinobacteria bacterium]|jgi:hypothetical protein|nr:serine/threonine protein kinase [Actinomycetota bacterium]MDA8186349.1 serine/threonine-protein kinase [Actinomycetota bacterium]
MDTIVTPLCGPYRLEKLLGQGGMADVYAAEDTRDGRKVAIKLVRSEDPALARRLAQEGRALADLNHPCLVKLFDTGVSNGRAYLVMELVEGTTLSARLRQEPLGGRLTAELGRALGSALAYVHSQGIVHRDVKPGNVLLGPGPRARLADFGIARLIDATSLTVTGTTLGTAAYMAPEQLEHHEVGAPADIYALGIVLLESLTGRRAFEGTPAEVAARRFHADPELPAGLSAPWRLLLTGMTARDSAKRPSAEEVASMLSAPAFSSAATVPVPALASGATVPATALAAAAAGAGNDSASTSLPGAALGTALGTDAAGTVLHGREPTRVLPPPGTLPGDHRAAIERHAGRARRYGALGLAALAGFALAGGLALALTGSGSASSRKPALSKGPSATVARSQHASNPLPTTTTTTTAPPPTPASAVGALSAEIESDTADGAMQPSLAKSLLSDLAAAVADAASGRPNSADQYLQAMDNSIVRAVQDGSLTQSAATSTLEADIAMLASTLGLAAPSTASSSSTSSSGSSGPATSAATGPGGFPGPPGQGGHPGKGGKS